LATVASSGLVAIILDARGALGRALQAELAQVEPQAVFHRQSGAHGVSG
jgi:hypothetical protein